ncbi:hypothetical protein [Scatolibacter rhodanostii]|uniref:hypothetical protein n=1 Tax=Scatolibacter rhodanostii TaxID=2014781 RepID=UPI000C079CA1|nr:hypothetical protein [Scatolibacter rhodanostii]
MKRKMLAIFGALVLTLSMTGCHVFRSEFPDYDVSGYITALLNSSYHGDNAALIDITNQTEAKANENRQTTVENGVIYFCNAFEINPSEAQKAKIEELVTKAYGMSKYTVRDKQENNKGYVVDVEIEPLTLFADILPEAQNLRLNADTLLEQKTSSEVSPESSLEEEDEYAEDEDTVDSEEEESSNEETAVVLTDVFIDKVIEMCEKEINAAPTYGSAITVSMQILRTEAGELQLDTTQLEEIDENVVLFKAQNN